MLNSRELATVIWLVLLIAFALTRGDVRVTGGQLVRSFVHWRIQVTLIAYAAYIAAIVWIAASIGLWADDLLKDTILWFILSGFPLIAQVNEAGREPRFFSRTVREIFGIGAIFVFFVNLSSFSLVGELVLQFLLGVLVMTRVVASSDVKYSSVRKVIDILLTGIVLAMSVYTVVDLYQQRKALDVEILTLSFLMTLWLPLVTLVFLFGFALFAGYELAFKRMQLAGVTREPVPVRARIGLVLGLNIHLGDVYRFAGGWGSRVKSAPTVRDAIRETRAFRAQRERQREEERHVGERLRRNAGVTGTDAQGKQFDQREFAETCEALRWIATCQMGWYRNRKGSYRPDLMDILGDFTSRGLPGEHGIEMRVRPDGQVWYAWRRTVTGWVFAIGAAAKPPDQWLYDGPEPPRDFPSVEAGWDHFVPGQLALNW